MRVLSIDLGTRNLGVCVAEKHDDKFVIEVLARVDLFEGTRITVTRSVGAKRLRELLHSYVCGRDWGALTHVLLEKQPGRNRRTVGLQEWLEDWSWHKFGVRAQLVDPNEKMSLCGGARGSHHANKKAAILAAGEWIAEHAPEWHDAYAALKPKQDDAADALLQLLAVDGSASWHTRESSEVFECCGARK